MAKFLAGGDYGFSETADGRQIYFHRNSVLDWDFNRLTVGSEVRFTEEIGEKGPQASTVEGATILRWQSKRFWGLMRHAKGVLRYAHDWRH